MKTYLAVMLGGAFGTGLRLWLSTLLTARYGETFPIGTLVVNVSGCLVIGLVAALAGADNPVPGSLLFRQVVMIGVLGGYTTFSSFSLQTFNLFVAGDWWRSGLYVILSVMLCLLAVWLGHSLASVFRQP